MFYVDNRYLIFTIDAHAWGKTIYVILETKYLKTAGKEILTLAPSYIEDLKIIMAGESKL